jgi:hypothetical protein
VYSNSESDDPARDADMVRQRRFHGQKAAFLALADDAARLKFLENESRCGVFGVCFLLLSDQDVRAHLPGDRSALEPWLRACVKNCPLNGQHFPILCDHLDETILRMEELRAGPPPAGGITMRMYDFFSGSQQFAPFASAENRSAMDAAENFHMRLGREICQMYWAFAQVLPSSKRNEFLFGHRLQSLLSSRMRFCLAARTRSMDLIRNIEVMSRPHHVRIVTTSPAAYCAQFMPDEFWELHLNQLSDKEFLKFLSSPAQTSEFGVPGVPMLVFLLSRIRSAERFSFDQIGANMHSMCGASSTEFVLQQEQPPRDTLAGAALEEKLFGRLQQLAQGHGHDNALRKLLQSLLQITPVRRLGNFEFLNQSVNMSVWQIGEFPLRCCLNDLGVLHIVKQSAYDTSSSITPYASERLFPMMCGLGLLQLDEGTGNYRDGQNRLWHLQSTATMNSLTLENSIHPMAVCTECRELGLPGQFASYGEKRFTFFPLDPDGVIPPGAVHIFQPPGNS